MIKMVNKEQEIIDAIEYSLYFFEGVKGVYEREIFDLYPRMVSVGAIVAVSFQRHGFFTFDTDKINCFNSILKRISSL